MAIQTAMTFEHQPSHRTKIVAFRLTPDDYERLNALARARGMQVGEWCRELALRFLRNPEGDAFQQAVLEEVMAVRTITSQTIHCLASGFPITAATTEKIWKQADESKRNRALKLLRQISEDRQGLPLPQEMKGK
jgi:predicted DNA-binding protein